MTRPRREPGTGGRRGDVMPYDYGATFPITGRLGNVVQSVINTAPDSLFVAVAVVMASSKTASGPLSFARAAGNGTVVPEDIPLGELPAFSYG
jgi:hypothetical protein